MVNICDHEIESFPKNILPNGFFHDDFAWYMEERIKHHQKEQIQASLVGGFNPFETLVDMGIFPK